MPAAQWVKHLSLAQTPYRQRHLKGGVIDTAGNTGAAKSQAYVFDNGRLRKTGGCGGVLEGYRVSSSDFITTEAVQDISGTLRPTCRLVKRYKSLDGVFWSDASATVGKNIFSLTGQTLSDEDDMKVRVLIPQAMWQWCAPITKHIRQCCPHGLIGQPVQIFH